jgi:hypothetical protein
MALKSKSKALTRESTQKDVVAALGEPKGKGIWSWSYQNPHIWTYLEHTDDSQHLSFTVTVDPEAGCSVSPQRFLRKGLVRGKRQQTFSGIILNAVALSGGGFDFVVRPDTGKTLRVVVANSARVKGRVENGSRIQVHHYGEIPGHYVFVGYYSLVLDSVVITKIGEQDAGGKRDVAPPDSLRSGTVDPALPQL